MCYLHKKNIKNKTPKKKGDISFRTSLCLSDYLFENSFSVRSTVSATGPTWSPPKCGRNGPGVGFADDAVQA